MHTTALPEDAGLMALVLIARFHGIAADSSQIRHNSALASRRFEEGDLVRAAKALKLKARAIPFSVDRVQRLPLPALMLDRGGQHFILARASKDKALIQEATTAPPRIISLEELTSRSAGRAILMASRASLSGDLARFDFSWFIPAMVKYRWLLLEVLGVSLLLQLFGLVPPLVFQVVMDKVLTNRAFSTLTVVCVALLATSVFETALTGLRNYLFAHTTTRMDVELGARLIRHLVSLPFSYFGARRVGDTVARVRELEHIRNFLTGQALTAVIDLMFSVVFIAVMTLYSGWLTVLVVLSLPIYAIISAALTPQLRARLNDKFARGADNQSFLVEVVSGMEPVKSLAVEPQFVRRWDNLLAAYVTAGFRVANLGNIGQQLIQLVGRIVTVLTLYYGARLVIAGDLTVGQLVAFNMLAQRVSAPVLRLAQMWQDFQQTGVSMQRLGDILNTRTELPPVAQSQPALVGEVALEQVRFRYRADGPIVLHDISLRIAAGEVIGIVGRSGSGKSTLARLLQRLYVPEHGRIRIDGIDLAPADPGWLRRQVSVVMQENVLFNRTIRENILISDPGLPVDVAIHAARLAGAHEFICEMQDGYETMVGEHGAGLSGGQRQRIAIARALTSNPRILIFDEATSALDYETEKVIHDNMPLICKGRTVIIISHRLSSVRHADRIIAIDKGAIAEAGTHEQLMQRAGYYAHLVSLQSG